MAMLLLWRGLWTGGVGSSSRRTVAVVLKKIE